MEGDEANERGQAELAKLCARDKVLVCGQASSHCVNFSARDLAAAWRKRKTAAEGAGAAPEEEDESARRRMAGIVLLKDGMSPVAGFESEASKFLEDMAAMGVSVRTCLEAFSA